MNRLELLTTLLRLSPPSAAIIAPLGFTGRDLYTVTGSDHRRCFFNLGAMGSVIPFALGVALSTPHREVVALEGDGSLLMNLGSLVTMRRYGPSNITIVILDNRCYESTGGQPSQPDSLSLFDVCRSVITSTTLASTTAEVEAFMQTWHTIAGPRILVARTSVAEPAPRIPLSPTHIARSFSDWLATGGTGK